jgi:hypothetical protein
MGHQSTTYIAVRASTPLIKLLSFCLNPCLLHIFFLKKNTEIQKKEAFCDHFITPSSPYFKSTTEYG